MSMPSNAALGELLGVSHATVSRWRSGDRLPELDNMSTIARVLSWSLDEQYQARQNGTWHDEFSRRVESRDPGGTVGEDATKNQQIGSRESAPDTPTGRRS